MMLTKLMSFMLTTIAMQSGYAALHSAARHADYRPPHSDLPHARPTPLDGMIAQTAPASCRRGRLARM